jgi:hypothetical protein
VNVSDAGDSGTVGDFLGSGIRYREVSDRMYRYYSVNGLPGLSETRETSQHLQCNGNTIDVGYTVLNERLLTRNPLSLQVSSVLTEIGF